MAGKRIGYIRVSSDDQNPERQLEGVSSDKIFVDRCSGKTTERPGLESMLEYVRDGDQVIVHSIDRIARNLRDLHKLIEYFTERKVAVQFIKENLILTGDDSPMSMLLMNVLGSVAQFEREIIRERQMEGIKLAKKRGVYKGGLPKLTPLQMGEIKRMRCLGVGVAKLARDFKCTRTTIYKYLKVKNGNMEVQR